MYVDFHCCDCDNDTCFLCPLGRYVPQDSRQGCTRKMDEDLYAQYEHLSQEVLPFMSLGQYKGDYKEFDEVNNFVFTRCPIGTVLDDKGKAIGVKKKQIDKYNSNLL